MIINCKKDLYNKELSRYYWILVIYPIIKNISRVKTFLRDCHHNNVKTNVAMSRANYERLPAFSLRHLMWERKRYVSMTDYTLHGTMKPVILRLRASHLPSMVIITFFCTLKNCYGTLKIVACTWSIIFPLISNF